MMNVELSIAVETSAQLTQARALATQWNIPIRPLGHSALQLVITADHIEIRVPELGKPIIVDFEHGKNAHRRRFGGGRRQTLAKAMGIKPNTCPTVIDATAGFGRDAFVFASLGCQVTLLERHPLIAVLLADALQRAQHNPDIQAIIARMTLIHADAIAYLHDLDTTAQPDVIYLDPMYPQRKKSAKVKKEMQLLHSLVGQNTDSAALLAIARNRARQRVVVKRPKSAPPITEQLPSLSLSSQHTRYDIYLAPPKN